MENRKVNIIESSKIDNCGRNTGIYFDGDRFDDAVREKGYNVYHERAVKCPCRQRNTNQPLSGCNNCGGIGWVFINKNKTKAIVQAMQNKPDFKEFSEINSNESKVTTLASDEVSYMDRLTIVDLLGIHSQILRTIQDSEKDVSYAWTIYDPIHVDHLFLFKSTSEPLVQVPESAFSVKNKRIELDTEFLSENLERLDYATLSVRYKHFPVYHIVDMVRELFRTDSTDMFGCGSLEFKKMPQYSIAKRAHYLWEEVDLETDADRIFDNSTKNG